MKARALWPAALLVLMVQPVLAVQLTYRIEGAIREIADESGYLGGRYSVGDSFYGTFAYSTDIPASESHKSPDMTRYNMAQYRDFAIDLHLPSTLFSTNGLVNDYNTHIELYNIDPGITYWADQISVQTRYIASVPIGPNRQATDLLTMNLISNPNTVFSDTNLPAALFLADFTNAEVYVTSYSEKPQIGFSRDFFVRGTITGMTEMPSSPVPEPSTMILLGSGIVGLLGYARKHRG